MSEQQHPRVVSEEPGTKYYCACGKTANAPYCDGSHEGTECKPAMLEIEEAKDVYICSCGNSANYPFCDGTHLNC